MIQLINFLLFRFMTNLDISGWILQFNFPWTGSFSRLTINCGFNIHKKSDNQY